MFLDSNNQTNISSEKSSRTIEKWINKTLRIELIDGRVVIGIFICTDNVPNIIINNAIEFWKNNEQIYLEGKSKKFYKRNIGMVIIFLVEYRP